MEGFQCINLAVAMLVVTSAAQDFRSCYAIDKSSCGSNYRLRQLLAEHSSVDVLRMTQSSQLERSRRIALWPERPTSSFTVSLI